jgi:hypothetical protein
MKVVRDKKSTNSAPKDQDSYYVGEAAFGG